MKKTKLIVYLTAWFVLVPFASTALAQTAAIDATVTNQYIRGFGASSAWHESTYAAGLATWYWDATNTVVNGGVTSASGIGLSMLRCHIPYSNSTSATGGTGISDPGETAVMKQAAGLGVTQIWCTEWTPPTAYKTNGATTCITCNPNAYGECTCADNTFNDNYSGYANYLTNYVQYANSQISSYGISIFAVSPQNEPDWNPTYESAIWTGAQFDSFVPVLYSDLKSASPSTKVMIPESFADNASLASTTMDDPAAAPDVGIIGNHLYGLNGAQPYTITSVGFTQYTNQESWETEMSDVSGAANDTTMKSGFQEAGWIEQCVVNASMNSFHHWWLYEGGTTNTNESLIGLDNLSTKKLWVLGNWSRFVRPGYYRMGATLSPAAGVTVSAFKNNSSTAPTTFVIVASNNNNSTSSITFNLTGLNTSSVTPWQTGPNDNLTEEAAVPVAANSFTYSMPVSSVVSFVGISTSANTATATATNSATNTATQTPTNTATHTSTNTATQTSTNTATNTATNSATNSATNTATHTSTNTATLTSTSTATNTATLTPAITSTFTNTATDTPTNTTSSTATNSPTSTSTQTATNTPTNTSAITSTFTNTPTDTSTNTASSTATNSATSTATHTTTNTTTSTTTNTPTQTSTNTATITPAITSTFTNTATNTSTNTPSSTATNTPTSTTTHTATNTSTVTSTNTATQTATNTATLTPANTGTFTNTATNTSTGTASSTSTNTSTLTATNSPTHTATTTPTVTSTYSKTNTPTATVTSTPTNTFTPTGTPTITPTFTPTITSEIIISAPYPNPSNGTPITFNIQVPGESTVTLDVFTLAFRKISSQTTQAYGAETLQWDLRDVSGVQAANGVYYVRIHVAGSQSITKILKVLILR